MLQRQAYKNKGEKIKDSIFHRTYKSVGGLLMSLSIITHGQCDAKPTVAFPAAERHRLLVDTKLYCLVSGKKSLL